MYRDQAFHSKPIALALASVIASVALSGCSSISHGNRLRPTVPIAARTSFVVAVKSQAKASEPTLDHVKAAFEDLVTGVRAETDFKDQEDWSFKETAATGGGAAALGQLASQTGLLNTGLLLAMVGLSLDSFYKPATTEATHLKAEAMFQCLQKELFFVSEADRVLAVQAKTGADKATTAVRDSIDQVDNAITRYRQAILSQGPSMPSQAEFARFAKQYASDASQADTMSVSFATQVATTRSAMEEKTSDVSNLTIARQKNEKSDLDLEQAKAAQVAAQQALKLAQAGQAAAKFVPLATNMEACVKNFTP